MRIGRQQITRAAGASVGQVHEVVNDGQIMLGIIDRNGRVGRRWPPETAGSPCLGSARKLGEVGKAAFGRPHCFEGVKRRHPRSRLIEVDAGIREEYALLSCTGGERGDVLNPALKDDAALLRDMPEVRRHEMAEAVRIGMEEADKRIKARRKKDPKLPDPQCALIALDPLTGEVRALVNIDLRGNVKPVLQESKPYIGWGISSRDGKRLAIWQATGGSNVWMLEGF